MRKVLLTILSVMLLVSAGLHAEPGYREGYVIVKFKNVEADAVDRSQKYVKTELAGKQASYKVKVVEIKEEKLPELNDDFASQVNPDFKKMDALREEISTQLKNRAEEKARIDYEDKAIEALINISLLHFSLFSPK